MKVSKATILALLAIPILVWAGATLAQIPIQTAQFVALKQRPVRLKPARTILNTAKSRADVIVVKFREGTRIRERAGQLEADLANLSDAEDRLLQRANLPRQRLFQDLSQVNALIAPNSKRFVRRLFTRPVDALDAEKRSGEARLGEELADLNLYYFIFIADAKPNETEKLLDQLNAMDSVEIAYPHAVASPAQVDVPPTTGNLTGSQGYLSPAFNGTNTTNGVDANYARLFPGGRGNDVQIIDVEEGWNLTHEDLPPLFFQGGPNRGDTEFWNHGTAVLGELAAAENSYGVTGVAPQSRIGVSSAVDRSCFLGFCWWSDNTEDAINRATGQLRIGDIMVIELHAPGPDSGLTAPCNADQFEYVPMEYWDANFDAIRNATSKGVIVVEAAGNGSMNLDSSIYSGKFDRSQRDSGAIMVGAGTSAGRAPKCFTNFGSRVDLQGWGENVTTLGVMNRASGGDIKFSTTDFNQWYTTVFSGTSSATPIVAGAAADLQGFRKARGLGPFTSVDMRNFLRQTGVAQASDPRQIGPLPNLRAAIDAHAPKRTLKVTFLNVKVVDNIFSGPQSLSFNFIVNNQSAQFPTGGGTSSFPQNTAVTFPANLSLTGQEVLNGGLTVMVSTSLRSVITFNPKTGQVVSVWNRPVRVLHSFPAGTNFGSQIFIGGSKTFTDRSTDASGYFDITYRVEVVNTQVLTQ